MKQVLQEELSEKFDMQEIKFVEFKREIRDEFSKLKEEGDKAAKENREPMTNRF